jgi:hypothetical protein
MEVGLDSGPISRANRVDLGANRDDLDAELMAEDSRIGDEWLTAAERMKISSADPDSVNTNQRVSRAHRFR